MNAWFADGNFFTGFGPVTGFGGQIAKTAVAVTNVQIASARRAACVWIVIAENGIGAGKIVAEWRLCDEQNRWQRIHCLNRQYTSLKPVEVQCRT